MSDKSRKDSRIESVSPLNIDQDDSVSESDRLFKPNSTYFTLSVYAIIVIILGTLSIKVIFNFHEITSALSNLISTFSSFVIAFFIAYMINPIVKLIDYYLLEKVIKLKSPKIRLLISIIVSYVLLITLFVLLLIYIIPELASSLNDFASKLPKLFDDSLEYSNDFFDKCQDKFPQLNLTYIKKQVIDSIPQLFKASSNVATIALGKVVNISVSIITTTITVIISIFVSTYMIAEKHIIAKNCTKLVYTILPQHTANMFCRTVKECNQIFYNFIIGKALDSLIIGVITFVTMELLNLNYAIMISIIVGITNMIPYFGPFIGAIPGVFILFVVSPIKGLIFAVLILIIQQFDGIYLGPKILGGSVGLSPLWVIFGITLGGAIFGPVGLFLGVPFVAVLAHLINKFTRYRLRNKHLDDSYFENIVLCSVEDMYDNPKYAPKKLNIFKRKKKNKPKE